MKRDTAFEFATANIRYGKGVTREVGMDLGDMAVRRVMVLTDGNLVHSPCLEVLLNALEEEQIDFTLYSRVRVEPTDASFKDAIQFAQQGNFDGFVAIGGGSTMDTAKAANLYSTYAADFLEYVNAPIGRGRPVPGPLKPLVAIPTTSGTGSETTGVSIFDFLEMKAKTGIAHRRLKPTLGVIDPDNVRSLPPPVVANTGLDVLSHALESYTALPFDQRPHPQRPILRPPYQGSNPVSDLWALEALKMVDRYLLRAFHDPEDEEAKGQMMLAASLAGIGFGNAGVHLPHGMSYPVAGIVRDYYPEGYETEHPLVPHGMAVILNAPAVFRFTARACPERHLRAAGALGAHIEGAREKDAGDILAARIIEFMQALNLPHGLAAIGFRRSDLAALVRGTLPQHRVTKISPRPAGEADLIKLFEEALCYW